MHEGAHRGRVGLGHRGGVGDDGIRSRTGGLGFVLGREAAVADSGAVWTQVNHSWSVQDGQAVATAGRLRIGYSVMATPVSDAFTVQADITLSPTYDRAAPALVTNWVDNKNNMVTKLEVTPGHPGGMLAVGDQIDGQIHSTLCKVDRLGLTNGATYRLAVTRSGDVVTGSVSSLEDGSLIGSCSANLFH
jgi:hypothetical protein